MDKKQIFMEKALRLADEALLLKEFPVGCVIEFDGAVVATGSRTNSRGGNEIDHAEIIALRNMLNDARGVDLSLVTVYSTMEPCLMCFSTLIVNGVRNFVYGYEDAMGGGTNLPLSQLAPLYRDIRVEIEGGVMRKDCLALFKTFFTMAESTYLKDSYLASYTLQQ
ncbi:MAG: tRNA-specific adenosine deaminase [Desulfotalea sp.]|nr:MAG: tRNA-specific adenosine deaminase [Desulfotalea sp.]